MYEESKKFYEESKKYDNDHKNAWHFPDKPEGPELFDISSSAGDTEKPTDTEKPIEADGPTKDEPTMGDKQTPPTSYADEPRIFPTIQLPSTKTEPQTFKPACDGVAASSSHGAASSAAASSGAAIGPQKV